MDNQEVKRKINQELNQLDIQKVREHLNLFVGRLPIRFQEDSLQLLQNGQKVPVSNEASKKSLKERLKSLLEGLEEVENQTRMLQAEEDYDYNDKP
ncbi:MAG: hypothetical protein LBV67_11425 [Streptococcaceae bacterium]|jgi:hypothetical protein|nr:hypothetical protein [Streptococcaceae bacterium]